MKNLLRTGWVQWDIKAERIESVAEHVYGTLMLTFAIVSEFELDVDFEKVILMLTFHELGECIIGDISTIDTEKRKNKPELEEKAVEEILKKMQNSEALQKLFQEFQKKRNKRSKVCLYGGQA